MNCSAMAKNNSVPLFAFLLLLFVLAISEVTTVGALCERASQTWSGTCKNTRHCDDQCKAWEHAEHGACHTRNGKKMCFCYFNKCPNAAKLAQDQGKELAGDTIQGEKVPRLEHPIHGPIPVKPPHPIRPPHPKP